MTYAVRYYTKTGNTKRLAQAIADTLGVEALPISVPVTEAVQKEFVELRDKYGLDQFHFCFED